MKSKKQGQNIWSVKSAKRVKKHIWEGKTKHTNYEMFMGSLQLAQIRSLQFDSQIILYVSDTTNHRIINLIHFKRFFINTF